MDIQRARDELFAKNETHGYVERENAIDEFLKKEVPEHQGERYVAALEYVLTRLSTPVKEDDLILGRMVEGPIPFEMEGVPGNGFSHINNPFRPQGGREAGHMSLDYESLMKQGLQGIVHEMEKNAVTDAQKRYAALAQRAAHAVREYALRYAQAAADCGKQRAADALRVVPHGPAYDFFSAVQGVWLMEMILSCVTGGRDFAYSRLDVSLWPYYDGRETEDTALEVLEAFYIKNNEIGGLNSDIGGEKMPVPCCSTNIYMMLGGVGAQHALPLSLLFLKAAGNVNLPQPITALRIAKDSPIQWKMACAHAAQTLSGQASFYNDDALIPNLMQLGYAKEHAINYTMSGCNRADFPGHQTSDKFHNAPARLLDAFYDPQVTTMEGLLDAFRREMYKEVLAVPGHQIFDARTDMHFFLESLLLRGCVENVLDVENGGQVQKSVVHHLCGAATVGNSLAAIQKAVFDDKIMTLDGFRDLVRGDFKEDPQLHQLIRNRYPKYGNDDEWADHWTAVAANIMVDATRQLNGVYDRIHIPCLYSLFYHHFFAEGTGCTPDGRLRGEPISENQSPVYGTDHEGITALMHSVSRLPQGRIGCGGLNVRLEKRLDNELIVGLTDAFFGLGCVNLCLDVMDRDTLLAALAHPDEYQTLCVRIVGYSEVFVRLPDFMQKELIERTTLAV